MGHPGACHETERQAGQHSCRGMRRGHQEGGVPKGGPERDGAATTRDWEGLRRRGNGHQGAGRVDCSHHDDKGGRLGRGGGRGRAGCPPAGIVDAAAAVPGWRGNGARQRSVSRVGERSGWGAVERVRKWRGLSSVQREYCRHEGVRRSWRGCGIVLGRELGWYGRGRGRCSRRPGGCGSNRGVAGRDDAAACGATCHVSAFCEGWSKRRTPIHDTRTLGRPGSKCITKILGCARFWGNGRS